MESTKRTSTAFEHEKTECPIPQDYYDKSVLLQNGGSRNKFALNFKEFAPDSNSLASKSSHVEVK